MLAPRLLLLALLACGLAAWAQPDATEEILKQAIVLHQAGNIAGAIQAYEKYLARRPDSVLALSNLGAAMPGWGATRTPSCSTGTP